MKSVVGPRNCALAIALPLTERRFLDDLKAADDHHYPSYIRSLYPAEGADDDYYWNIVYRRFADLMRKTIKLIAKLGVTIVRDATLDDFRCLTRQFSVVTLVSHWRFRVLRPEEICDLECLRRALLRPPSRLAGAFRDALERIDASLVRGSAGREDLATALNQVLHEGHRDYAAKTRASVLKVTIPALRLTRPTLERAFAGAIAAGRAVEFADGMKTIPDVVSALAPDYAGFLDMTVCNSAIIGEEIKAERPRCTLAVNRYPTEPHIRLALYRRFARALNKNPQEIRKAFAQFGNVHD
jgi:hypothetical protein